MKKITLLFSLMCLALTSNAYENADDTSFWHSEAALIEFTPEEVAYGDATILEDNRAIIYKARTRETERHSIVYVKTQEGLDDNNKIVIYVPNEGKILDIKARSISANGTVVELNKDNIKEMKDFSEGGNLKVFAIEGAEVGGQVEYVYRIQTPLYDSGKEYFSMDYKTKHACVFVSCISAFSIGSKGLNAGGIKMNTSKKQLYVFKEIAPIKHENYATPKANRVAVEHKLKGNDYVNTTFANYANVLEKFVADFFNFEKKELKKVKSLLKSFEVTVGNEEETLRNLNVFLKDRFFYEDNYSSSTYNELLGVIKSETGNDVGLTKLYCAVLQYLNISYEVLVTANKYSNRIDENYCSRHSLTEYIIYIPIHKTYIYPSAATIHLGLVPSWIAGSNALIVRPDMSYVKFREIPSQSSDENQTGLSIKVDLDLMDNSSVFSIDAYGTGQLAYNYNTDIYYSDSEEEIKEEVKAYVSWRYPDGEIMEVKRINPEKWGDIGACEDFECKREFTAKVKSTSFFDQIGNKMLINVGTLLGPQTEMYSELERVQPITCSYNKSYVFKIQIPIPAGYVYRDSENANINNSFEDDNGEVVAGFKSEVKVENNIIYIDIFEFYNRVNIDKKYYEDYRRVINSAADFNKATLLLEKE